MSNLRVAQYGQEVQYLVFDVEAVADGELIAKVRYPQENYTPQEAIRAYRDELIEQRGDGKDFIPRSVHVADFRGGGKSRPRFFTLGSGGTGRSTVPSAHDYPIVLVGLATLRSPDFSHF